MSPPELFEDVALHLLADLQRHQREGAPMPIDPGRTTRQVQPHPGDDAARRIRAALQRLDGSTGPAVSLLTGIDRTGLDTLGGFEKEIR